MANSWFRLYSEFADDPKVQMMPEAMQRRLIMLFCLRSRDVLVTLRDDEIAFHLRISEDELAKTKSLFIEKGFIDGDWNVSNWSRRQYDSDSSTTRTRRYRERVRTSQGTSHVTTVTKCDALDTEQNRTEQIQNRTEQTIPSPSLPDPKPTPAPPIELPLSKKDFASFVQGMVIDQCRFTGRWVAVTLHEVAKAEFAEGTDPVQLASNMGQAWVDYSDAVDAGKIAFPCKAESFFADGKWKSKAAWGWKPGLAPVPPPSPSRYVCDADFSPGGRHYAAR